MRKILLFVAVMIVGSFAWGQNWQCVQENVIRHYNGLFVRGMKIDSVQTINNDVVFYPFHTPRGGYVLQHIGILTQLDTNGGSWLGKKIILKQDGMTLFDTYWGDTVFIRTTANVGDSWTFYNDSSNRYYIATVTGVDTATVLNSLDSVKTIAITAYDNGVLNTSDIAQNQTIILSKNHGIFKTFSVYTFPFHPPQSNAYQQLKDYILDNRDVVGGVVQSYSLFGLRNLSYNELCDFNVGDVFEYEIDKNIPSIDWRIDSVMTKTMISPNNYVYTIKEHYTAIHFQPPNQFYSTIDSSIVSCLVHTGLAIDTNSVQDYDLIIISNDSQFCFQSVYLYRSESLWHRWDFEPCFSSYSYKVGFGQLSEVFCYDPVSTDNYFWHLIYSRKNNIPCGNYHPLVSDVNDITLTSISISPNPTTGQITIKGITQPTVAVYNLMGQKVVATQGCNEVNLAQLPTGMYLIQVFNKDMELVKSEKVIKE